MGVIEVAIGPGGEPGRFRVEVVRSLAGEASAEVALDTVRLQGQRPHLQQALLASSVPARQILTEGEQLLREAGQELFTALLGTGEVAGRYRASAALADNRGEGLRVVLRIGAPELAVLPWEAMYDQATGAYVARHDQLVRHVPVAAVLPPLQVSSPLRVLGIVSSPRGLPPLDTGKEQEQLAASLARPTEQGLVELYWAPAATWADLHDMLLAGPWHVVHFIGHGDFDPDEDEGVLALTGQDGRADLVEASRLVDLLRQARPMPRLVVLNSCSGAATSQTDLFSGTAAALVRSGVSAVAAMQYSISDQAALAFSRGFYTAIAHGRGVDDALSAGRVAILGTGRHTLEWATPVLYLRGNRTQLFAIPAVAATGQRTGRVADPGADADPPSQAVRQPGPPLPRQAPPPAPAPLSLPGRLMATYPYRKQVMSHPLVNKRAQSVAFSPDGTLLATGGADHTVRLWAAGAELPARELTGHKDEVLAVAFSPGGNLLASAGSDDSVLLWDVASGIPIEEIQHQRALGVAFSPDGSALATCGADRKVQLWRVPSGQPIGRPAEHSEWVRAVAFSPDGNLIATACDDASARLWELPGVKLLHLLEGHEDYVRDVAFSPDGSMLASASDDQSVIVWDTAAGRQLHQLIGHKEYVQAVAFRPDGALLAATYEASQVRFYDPLTGTRLGQLSTNHGPVAGLAFAPDGRLLATAGETAAELWE